MSGHPRSAMFQPENCINYRLRRAARTTAKAFDDALRPAGIRNTQFTVIAALHDKLEISIGGLSTLLAIDGTTMTRNLDLLAAKGLVEDVPAEDARMRRSRLTPLGLRTYEQALPLWQAAQARFLGTLQEERWPGMLDDLGAIENA